VINFNNEPYDERLGRQSNCHPTRRCGKPLSLPATITVTETIYDLLRGMSLPADLTLGRRGGVDGIFFGCSGVNNDNMSATSTTTTTAASAAASVLSKDRNNNQQKTRMRRHCYIFRVLWYLFTVLFDQSYITKL